MDYVSAKRSAPADTSRNLSGNRWEKAGLDSLRRPTCLPAHFSFNVWPRVKMAASSTGRLEVNPSNLVGHGRLLLFSLSAVPTICLEHVDGVRETASRAWSCCALITRFKGSCVFSPFRWQRRGKNEAPPQLDSCAPDPNENDISPLTFTVLAPAGHFYEKGDRIWPKKQNKPPTLSVAGRLGA